MAKNKLIYFLLITAWILSGFIVLAFIGYVIWNFFQIDFFLGLSCPILLIEIYWRDFYWLVLLILAIAYPASKLIANKKLVKFTLISATVSLVMWLVIPYMNDYSYEPALNENKVVRLTQNFRKTNNPAFRLQQSVQYVFDSGCNYWLERWSSDGKYLRISEKPYGIRHCLESDEAVIDTESTELIYDFDSIEFLERPWPERSAEIVSNYIKENKLFLVIDALPSPNNNSYAIVIGKSSLAGPSDIFLIMK